MAARGPKPKPNHLRLVDGTHRVDRHGARQDARAAVSKVEATFGPLTKPKDLKGEAADAWRRWIVPAFWLDGAREPSAIALCLLWQEFHYAPTAFPAAKHGQMRAYMSELGLSDERQRAHKEPADDPQEDFFDD